MTTHMKLTTGTVSNEVYHRVVGILEHQAAEKQRSDLYRMLFVTGAQISREMFDELKILGLVKQSKPDQKQIDRVLRAVLVREGNFVTFQNGYTAAEARRKATF